MLAAGPTRRNLNGLGQGEDMLQLFNALLLDESGQDLAEYAILIGLIAIAVIVAVRLLGTTISNVFNSIGSSLSGAAGGGPALPPPPAP